MNAQEMIGLCQTSNPGFAQLWADICIEGERKEKEWIAALRSHGVKAAHPNDGWIDREKNELHFCYPQFNDGAGIGDIVALGWASDAPGKTKFVRLTGCRKMGFISDMIRWQFEYV
jgi:hypothetical protein